MKENKVAELKNLEELVLTRNDKTPIFRDKDVKVRQIAEGKNGPEYEILDEDDKKIGIVKDDKTFIFDENYKKDLKAKMGPMYDLLGFDKEKIRFDVLENIKEQEEKYRKKDDKVIEPQVEVKEEMKQEVKPHQKQEPKKEENILTEEQLKAYNNVQIKDFEFVADMVNPNIYDINNAYFINRDGKFHMMVLNKHTDKYEEVNEYLRKDMTVEAQDTLEKNREETEIGIAQKVTYKDRYGDRVELNYNQLDSGEIEARVSHRHREGDKTGDIDRDGDNEGIKIATDRDRVNPKIKQFDHIKEDVNEVKENNYIESDEINQGELSTQQIREIINEKIEEEVISEHDEVELIQTISVKYPTNNPTREQLEELIDEFVQNKDEKEIEYGDDDEEREPGYTRGPDGILRFHGRPVE